MAARSVETRFRRVGLACLWALLLAYGGYLSFYFVPIAGGSDSSGYLNSAALFASGDLKADVRDVSGLRAESPFAQTPLGFVLSEDGRELIPTYPAGVPLLFAAAQRLAGRVPGMYLVEIGGALAAILYTYLIGRRVGLSTSFAAIAAGLVAINPVFIFIAIQPLSDVLATTGCVVAAWWALRSEDSAKWAVAAGVAAAVAVLVRPSNLLIFPALLLLLRSWKSIGWFIAGGLPGAVWLAWYQHSLYGSALRSGYGDIWAIFRWSNLSPTISYYATWLPRLLPWLLLVGLAAAVFFRPKPGRTAVAFTWWAGSVFLFYAFYDVTREAWWCLRFILPALPVIAIGGAWGLQSWALRLGGGRRWVAALLALMLAVTGARSAYEWGGRLAATGPSITDTVYLEATEWAARNLPERAVVVTMFASGAVHYYTDFAVVRWDALSREEFRQWVERTDLAAQPVYALLFTEEREAAIQQCLSGTWQRVYFNSRIEIWRLTAAEGGRWIAEDAGRHEPALRSE